jgi:5-methylcytosine-specific restriction endonuclease McrA
MWYSRNRRAQINASDETITTKDWIDICERWGNKCLCCGKSGNYLTLTLDHVFPLIDGGQHKKNNIQPLCKSCNSRKGAKYIDYRRK